jgi:hypothetical protein
MRRQPEKHRLKSHPRKRQNARFGIGFLGAGGAACFGSWMVAPEDASEVMQPVLSILLDALLRGTVLIKLNEMLLLVSAKYPSRAQRRWQYWYDDVDEFGINFAGAEEHQQRSVTDIGV